LSSFLSFIIRIFHVENDPLEKEKAFFAKEYQTAQEELKRQEKEGNRSPKKARELI